jgi:hypothetical protein
MIKALRIKHSTPSNWSIARRTEARTSRAHMPWLRDLVAGLSGLGSMRVMPGALDSDRRAPPRTF